MGEIFKGDVCSDGRFGDNLHLRSVSTGPVKLATVIAGLYLSNVVMEPFGAKLAMSTSIVSIVVARHVVEHIGHSLLLDPRKERPDQALVNQFGKICRRTSTADPEGREGTGSGLTGFASGQLVHLVRIELFMLRDVYKLLPLSTKAQFIAFCHPFCFLGARNT